MDQHLARLSTIKLEKVYSTVDPAVEHPTDFYINHSVASIYNSGQRVRGAHLSLPDADNFSLNVALLLRGRRIGLRRDHAQQCHEHADENRFLHRMAGTDKQ